MAWFPTDQNPFTGVPGQRLRVFISAAQKELAAERSAIRQAVARLNLTPVMFDSFARPHPPRELYQAYLAQSDIYIGVYWQQYGFIGPGEAISALEDEYSLASGLPRLVYIKTPAPQREDRLKDLLARIKQEGPVAYRYFSTAEALAGLVENDLASLLTGQFATDLPAWDSSEFARDGPPNNLPVEVDRFIGREIQVDAIARLLLQAENRLVSLTGPGGIGKTRLALKAAASALEHFPGGTFFVDLSTIDDPALVVPVIARALGEPETAGEQIQEKLKAFLHGKRILLVLDNMEQKSSAQPLVGELLAATPELKVLATSRVALRAPGEMEFPVPPLDLPNPAHHSPEAIRQNEAVQLFVDRAGSGLDITPVSIPPIVEICRRLDGLPLAIELAAARAGIQPALTDPERVRAGVQPAITYPERVRASTLPPAALLDSLTSHLSGQDRPTRQQILRVAMEWSYLRLPPDGQTIFARLAAFHGGCTLDAIETVCNPGGRIDVLEVSGTLASSRLVQRELDSEGRLRFFMMDILHDFALERLNERGETAALQERHALYYMALGEEAAAPSRRGNRNLRTAVQSAGSAALYSPDEPDVQVLDRQDAEIENLRAALAWSLAAQSTLEQGARLANNLFWFWNLRGRLSEGQAWYRRFLQSDIEKGSAAHAGLLARAGILARELGEPCAARRLLDESIPALRGMSDRQELPRQELPQVLLNRGMIALDEGRVEDARTDLEDALELFRELGQRSFTGLCLMHLASAALALNRLDTARKQLAETAAIARTIGSPWLLPSAINSQGEVARFQNDYSRAGGYYDESGALFHKLNARGDLARVYHNQAYVALQRGDSRLASSLFRQGLELNRQLGIRRGAAECLAGLADVDAAQGRLMPAARLLGFAQALIESLSTQWSPADRREIERLRASLQKTLGEELFSVEEAAGREQKLEEVLVRYEG